MTVKQLIEILNTFNQDAKVMVSGHQAWDHVDLTPDQVVTSPQDYFTVWLGE